MNELPEVYPLRDIKAYGAAVAQATREEILQAIADWASPAMGEIVYIKKLGLYGAVTATFGLYKGRKVISEEGCVLDATTFGGNWDNVPDMKMVLKPGEKLKLYMTDSAVDPLGIVVAVLGSIVSL